QRMLRKVKMKKNAMTRLFLVKSPHENDRFITTMAPATIRARKMFLSSGLPSTYSAPDDMIVTLPVNHSEGIRDEIINNQSSGIQSACDWPLFILRSRTMRQMTKTAQRDDATNGGISA